MQDTFLSASDFHVGAVVNIFARLFLMTDADTFTLQYMETEPDKFPFASFEKVRPTHTHTHTLLQAQFVNLCQPLPTPLHTFTNTRERPQKGAAP